MDRQLREAKIRALAEAYAERLRQAWPEGATDITGIEEIAERVGSETSRDLTEELVRKQAEAEPVRETACPHCAGPTRFKGRYAREVVTALGRVHVQSAYYYCAACQTGSCPRDRQWGLGAGNATPTVQARVAVLGAWVPYTRVPQMTRQIGMAWGLDVKTSELL